MRCTQPLFSACFGVVSVRCEGFRVTPRDREIVRWIGRHRMVTAGQVAERFGVGRSQCYARLTGLVRFGLLSHERLLYGRPGVYLATRSGLDVADVPLPAASVDLRTYAHDLELTSLVTELEQKAPTGTAVWTERELRSVDAPAGRPPGRYEPRFAVELGQANQLRLTPAGSPRVHFPDAAIVNSGRDVTAIELELTAKGRTRLRSILRAYVAARHIAEVVYYASHPGVLELLQDEIAGLRAEDVIRVKRGASGELNVTAA